VFTLCDLSVIKLCIILWYIYLHVKKECVHGYRRTTVGKFDIKSVGKCIGYMMIYLIEHFYILITYGFEVKVADL